MLDTDGIIEWTRKEALIVGSEMAGFVGLAEIGAPLIYLMAEHGNYRTAPMHFSFSINDLAKITAVGYPAMTAILRLPPLRCLRMNCGQVDDDTGNIIFSVLANYVLAPASLALGAAILDTNISVGGAFMFGYLAAPFGLITLAGTGYLGYQACMLTSWANDNGCCIRINFPEFGRNARNDNALEEGRANPGIPEAQRSDGEISEIQGQVLSLYQENRPRPIIFSQNNHVEEENSNTNTNNAEAQIPNKSDRTTNSFRCTIL